MIFVLITEFINTYIPPLASFILWLCTLIFGDQEAMLNDEARKRRAAGLPPKKVNDRYSAFVAISDGSSVIRGGKKKRKEAIKKDDQKAVQQLKRIGRDAQYRHNSFAFLQRHRIGPFRDDTAVDVKTTTTTTTKAESPKRSTKKRKGIKEDEEEEEVDWVVEALSAKSVQREQSKISSSSSMFKPTVGVSLSDGTPSMEVGLSFSIGGRNDKPATSKKKKRSTSGSKKKKNRKSVLEAATEQEMTQKKRKKTIISDRDGGIMGRIRDFSANNLVSRSLMGAYPGDAAPPSEAASANGVYQIAEKYGFGDWSDEDDDDEEDHVENTEDRTKRRKRRRRKTVRGGLKTRKKNQPTILTTTLLDDPIQDKKRKTTIIVSSAIFTKKTKQDAASEEARSYDESGRAIATQRRHVRIQ